MQISKISDVEFQIDKEESEGMKTAVTIYATENMLEKMKKDTTLQQAKNTTTLPGIVGNVLVMPDGHQGYGFPVGGVVAFDANNGIVSPGINGYDINCGMRLIKTNLTEKDIKPKLGTLMDKLFANVPSGVGSKFKAGFTASDLERVAEEGVGYIIKKGFGFKDDVEKIEENGCIAGADYSKISDSAKKRGREGLGTLGAGNHFLEVQKIDKIFNAEIGKRYGLYEGQIVVMVHTGSRGFGHQTCSDYLRICSEYQRKNNISLVDQELSYADIGSKEADDYLGAMRCAINFAFSNRQVITDSIRKSFEQTFGKSADALGMDILYDLAHNIIKFEEHVVDGKRMELCVHRKGATRAFAKNRKEVPKIYRDVGQPVIIPGSMGTASYILAGAEGAMERTFGSACHGSGRVMSRHQAIREIPASRTFGDMDRKKIEVRVKTRKLISEEAEWAYKDVDEVVKVVDTANIAKIISRNVPLGVAKG